MLISKKHNFIFVHVPKTGGSSIQKFLVQNLHWKEYIGIFENDPHTEGKKKGMRKHMRACEIKKLIPNYESYIKIAVVRNPWDLVVSWYTYVKRLPIVNERSTKGLDFSYFIKNMKEVWNGYGEPNNTTTGITQWDYVSKNGKLIVDRILKYEELKQIGFHQAIKSEFRKYIKRKAEHAIWKPMHKMKTINASIRKSDYRTYYDEEIKEIVTEAFKKDIEKFKYQY